MTTPTSPLEPSTRNGSPPSTQTFVSNAVEAFIRIGLLAVLILWCFQIFRPFLVPVVWGVIIAVASYPGYRRLRDVFGGRRRLAATVFTLLALVVLIVPTVLLAGTLVDTAQSLAADVTGGTLDVPPPPDSVAGWPVVGPRLAEIWSLASENLQEAVREFAPQIRAFGSWLLSTAAVTGLGILQFVVAIVIAGVLLAYSKGGHDAARLLATRLVGPDGSAYADLAEATTRNVARGILGVALIQSILAGLGFLAVGLPAAGLLALICLLLSVIQIGVGPVVIPAVIYVFATADMVTAIPFLIWSVFVIVIDNVLKPILLGRGAKVPMVVIFVGAIGGFPRLWHHRIVRRRRYPVPELHDPDGVAAPATGSIKNGGWRQPSDR